MKDKTRRMVYVPEELYQRAQKFCKEYGLSFSGLVCIALNEYMKQNEVVDFMSKNKELKDILKEAVEEVVRGVKEK